MHVSFRRAERARTIAEGKQGYFKTQRTHQIFARKAARPATGISFIHFEDVAGTYASAAVSYRRVGTYVLSPGVCARGNCVGVRCVALMTPLQINCRPFRYFVRRRAHSISLLITRGGTFCSSGQKRIRY